MNDQQILEKLQDTVNRVLGQDAVTLTDKTDFRDLGFNSFTLVQLVCVIEEEFNIEIPNSAIKTIKIVRSAIKYIKQELKKQGL